MSLEKIKELRQNSKERNFTQRFDLIINLKDIDLNKPASKIDEIFVLPNGSDKKSRITLFLSDETVIKGCEIIPEKKIESLGKNKKELKKLITRTDIFLAEPKLMTVVGKHLGKYLAPRGLMPKPVAGNTQKMVDAYQKGVRLAIKKQPNIMTVIGAEDMKDEDILANVKAVVEHLKTKLPKGKDNISEILLKLTMSKPVKMEV